MSPRAAFRSASRYFTRKSGETDVKLTSEIDCMASSSPERYRGFYLRTTLVLYAAWGAAFVAVGMITISLPKTDLKLPLDGQIPLLPEFIWCYLVTYALPFALVGSCKNWHQFNRAVLGVIVASPIAFSLFLMFPVEIPRPAQQATLSSAVLAASDNIDSVTRANNFPSLHVAFTLLFTLCFIRDQRRLLTKIALCIIALMISLSTLFVKQHLVVDVLAGSTLAFIASLVASRLYAASASEYLTPPEKLKSIIVKNGPLLAFFSLLMVVVVWARWIFF